MGLDMYLQKKTYVWQKERETLKIEGVPGVNPSRVCYIVEEMGYWRKANAIHKWFVDNVQNGVDDCGDYYVSKEQLADLLVLVKKVLKNKKKAHTILPTQSGFFFGGTDYDEWYFKDLEDTKKIIETILNEKDNELRGSYYYHSSW